MNTDFSKYLNTPSSMKIGDGNLLDRDNQRDLDRQKELDEAKEKALSRTLDTLTPMGGLESRVYEGEIKDYVENNISISQDFDENTLYKLRAKNQSGMEKFFNSVVMQGFVGIGLVDMIGGFGDLYDLMSASTLKSIYKDTKNAIENENGEMVEGDDYMYRNALSEWAHRTNEKINKNFQVYYNNPNEEKSMFNGGLMSSDWYFQNLPSVWTYLTFLVPSGAAVKGLSMLGKIAKGVTLANRITKGEKIAKGLINTGKAIDATEKAGKLSKAVEGLNSVEKAVAKSSQASKLSAAATEIAKGSELGGQKLEQYAHSIFGTYLANNMFARDIAYQHEEALTEAFKDEQLYQKVLEENPYLKQYADDKEKVIKLIANKAATRDWEWNILTAYTMYGQVRALNNWWRQGSSQAANRAINKEVRLAKEALLSEEKRNAITTFNNSTKGKVVNWFRDGAYGKGTMFNGAIDAGIGNAINVGAEYAAKEVINSDKILDKQTENMVDRAFDAAVWGVIGGLFANVMTSGVGKIMPNSNAKYDENVRTEDIKTWNNNLNEFVSKVEQYKKGISDYYELDEKGNKQINPNYKEGDPLEDKYLRKSFESEAEKELAIQRSYDSYITKMALHSMNVGNFDIIQSYLKDKDVAEGLSNGNKISKEESISLSNRVSKIFDNVQTKYEKNIKKCVDLGINPYISQVIAQNDTAEELNAEFYERAYESANNEVEKIKQNYVNDPNFSEEEFYRQRTAYENRLILKELRRQYQYLNYIKNKKGIDYDIYRQRTENRIKVLNDALGKDIKFLQYHARIAQKFDKNGNALFDKNFKPIYDKSMADEYLEEAKKEYETDAEKNGLEGIYEKNLKNMQDDADEYAKRYGDAKTWSAVKIDAINGKNNSLSNVSYSDEEIVKKAMKVWSDVDIEAALQVANAKATISSMMSKYDYDEVYDYISEHKKLVNDEEVDATITNITEEDLDKLDEAKNLLGLNINIFKEFIEDIDELKNNFKTEKLLKAENEERSKHFGYTMNEIATINKNYKVVKDKLDEIEKLYNEKIANAKNELDRGIINKEMYDNLISDAIAERDGAYNDIYVDYSDQIEAYNKYEEARTAQNTHVAEENEIPYTNQTIKKGDRISFERNNKLNEGVITSVGTDSKTKEKYVYAQVKSGDKYKLSLANIKSILPNKRTQNAPKVQTDTNVSTPKKVSTEAKEIPSTPATKATEPVTENSSTGEQTFSNGEQVKYNGKDCVIVSYDADNEVYTLKSVNSEKLYKNISEEDIVSLEEKSQEEQAVDDEDETIDVGFTLSPDDTLLLIDAYNNKDEDAINEIVERIKPDGQSIDEFRKSLDDLFTRQSSVKDFMLFNKICPSGVSDVNYYTEPYINLLNRVLNDYINTENISLYRKDNNLYIDIVPLLKYIYDNSSKGYQEVANLIKGLRETFKSNDKKYIDGKNISSIDDLSLFNVKYEDGNYDVYVDTRNLMLQEDELRKLIINEPISTNTPQKVDISTYATISSTNNLQIGDNITTNVTKTGDYIEFKKGDSVLGKLPIYKIRTGGVYECPTDGFITDVKKTSKGFESNLINSISTIFKAVRNGKNSELFNILTEYIRAKNVNTDNGNSVISSCIDDYMKLMTLNNRNKVISNDELSDVYTILKNAGRNISNFNDNYRALAESQLEYLSKLYSYLNGFGLDLWCQKLGESAQLIADLSNNPKNYDISIKGVNQGKLYYSIKDADGSVDKGPVSERLANYKNESKRGGKRNTYRLACCSKDGYVTISGRQDADNSMNAKKGNTFIAIDDKGSGFVPYAHAYGVPIESIKSKIAINIINDIKKEFKSLLVEHLNNASENRLPENIEHTFKAIGEYLSRFFYTTSRAVAGRDTALFRIKDAGLRDSNEQVTLKITDNQIVLAIPGGKEFVMNKTLVVDTEDGKKKTISSDSFYIYSNQFDASNVEEDMGVDPEGRGVDPYIDALFNELEFDMNFNLIEMDGHKNIEINNSLSFDKDGKFVINVGGNEYKFRSYSDFLLDNDLVDVSVNKYISQNGKESNFIPNSDIASKLGIPFNKFNSPNIILDIKPKKEVVQNDEKNLPVEESSNENSDIKKIEDILNSDSTTKVVDIVSILMNLDKNSDKIKNIINLNLLPKDIIYDKNEKDNASITLVNGVARVGEEFMNFVRNNQNELAIKTLIHEQLHYLLNSNESERKTKLDAIAEIYDTYCNFINNVENDNVLKSLLKDKYSDKFTLDEYKELLQQFQFTDKSSRNLRLEEFLVESITNRDLVPVLNAIKIENNSGKQESLWQKFMKWILNNILGIEIVKNSLLEKEFYSLYDNISEKNTIFVNKKSSLKIDTNLSISFDDNKFFRQSTVKDFSIERNAEVIPSTDAYIDSYPISERNNISKLIDEGVLKLKCF